MIDLSLLIAPIFLIILLGYILKNFLITDEDVWNHLNRLAYWVLFPCLLFNKTSVIDFAGIEFGALSLTVLSGFSAAVIFCFLAAKLAGLSAPTITSVIQGGGRHNAFLALAIVSQLYGEQGAMLGAIIIAVLVTFTNIVVNISMSVILNAKGGGLFRVLSDLKRNPFIFAIAVGAFFNVLGLGNLPVLHTLTLSIGETTLTIALLCVGAGLRMRGLGDNVIPAMIALFGKFIIFPLTVYLLAQYFSLAPVMTMAAMIFAVSPTGAASYPLAKQMGGDAPLMATLISLQTLLSVLIMPLIIILLS